ncbi:hypothetical protein IV102_02570 [bacterium]|nr:hypothetical protein [bacterium]
MARMVRLQDSCFASPIGSTSAQVTTSLRHGKSGICDLQTVLPGQQVLFTGAITKSQGDATQTRFHPRLSQRYNALLFSFSEEVSAMVKQHGSVDKVFLICKRPFYSKWVHRSTGDFQESDFVNTFLAACSLESLGASRVCQIQAACSTGVLALNWAIRELATAGKGHNYLLLGLETELNAEKFVAFKKLGALSTEPDPSFSCQPFGQSRSGLVPGEVLVAVLLQSVEDSQIETGDILLRAGVTNCDASRLTDGLETGDFLTRCLERTLGTEELQRLDFICPHATSTPLNDALEAAVLGRFLAQTDATPWIVPLKQYIGHTLNSSGLWETLLSAFLLRHGFLPPLLNPPEACLAERLRFVQAVEERTLSRAMKLSIGFGGINSAVLLDRVS